MHLLRESKRFAGTRNRIHARPIASEMLFTEDELLGAGALTCCLSVKCTLDIPWDAKLYPRFLVSIPNPYMEGHLKPLAWRECKVYTSVPRSVSCIQACKSLHGEVIPSNPPCMKSMQKYANESHIWHLTFAGINKLRRVSKTTSIEATRIKNRPKIKPQLKYLKQGWIRYKY